MQNIVREKGAVNFQQCIILITNTYNQNTTQSNCWHRVTEDVICEELKSCIINDTLKHSASVIIKFTARLKYFGFGVQSSFSYVSMRNNNIIIIMGRAVKTLCPNQARLETIATCSRPQVSVNNSRCSNFARDVVLVDDWVEEEHVKTSLVLRQRVASNFVDKLF